jgi:hypothetical protein
MVRLGTKKPDYFIDGSHSCKNLLRRRIWDNTNLANSQFRVPEIPAVHNLLTFSDEFITLKEYEEFQ